MKDAQADIRRFMERINTFAAEMGVSKRQSIGTTPQIFDGELRAALIMEEARETAEALTGHKWEVIPHPDNTADTFPPSIVGVADGCADILVVTIGTAIACGFELEPVFAEVMRSNWTKFLDGATIRADGKLVKSPSFEEPHIAEVLGLKHVE